MSAIRSTCALLFAFLAIACARKDQGEYWVTVTKEEALIPESEALKVGAAIIADKLITDKEDIAVFGDSASKGKGIKSGTCDHETDKHGSEDRSKGFSDDFEPRPNVSAYGEDDVGLKEKREEHKHFADDFEPRPNVSAYGEDDVGLKVKREGQKHFADDFEQRPNISAYGEDEVGLKVKKN